MTNDTARAYQALQVFRLGAMILLGVVLVKCSFTTSEIGDFEWFLFISNTLSFFWSLGLKNAFMSYFPKLEKKEQSELIFNLGLLFLGLGCIVAMSVSFIGLSRLESLYLYLPSLVCFIILGVTASLSEHILIVQEKAKALFYFGLLSFLTYLVLLAGIAFFTHSIQYLFYGLALWALMRFFYFAYLLTKFGRWNPSLKLVYPFVLFGLPLIMQVLLGGGMEYVDGFLVDTFFDHGDFALFRYGAKELPINTIFISAMASALIPAAVVNLTLTLVDIKKRISRLMHFLFPVSMVLMILSPYLFTWIYSDEYLISAEIFNVYLLIICSRILLPQTVLYAQHRNKVLMLAALVELMINIGLSILLLQYLGMVGIALATVIAYMIQKVLLITYAWRVLGVRLSEYLEVKTYFYYSTFLYLLFAVSFHI